MAKRPKRQSEASAAIRQRIIRTVLVSAKELKRHPRNFRQHGVEQRRDVEELLTRIGQVSPVIAREAEDGALHLLDGHLRQDIADDRQILVAVTDLTEREGDVVLSMLDYTASQATIDPELARLMAGSIKDVPELSPISWEGFAAMAGVPSGEVSLNKLDVMPPPKMSWVLVGIPTVRFSEVSSTIETLAKIDGIVLETTANDG